MQNKDLRKKKCYNYSINKIFWSKHKRVLLIAFAIVFLVAVFFLRNGLPWNNKGIFSNTSDGLRYENALIEEVVTRDTDADGVYDWEETLWGLDPSKTETTPGTPDIVVVGKLRAEKSGIASNTEITPTEEKLSETDKFSRELFSTIASLNQNGSLDADTLNKLGESLASRIQDTPQKKIYALTDISTTSDSSSAAIKTYSDTLERIHAAHPIKSTAIQVLEKMIIDEENIDTTALSELGVIADQTEKIISDLLKVKAPAVLAQLHLNFINKLQAYVENLNAMELFEQDVVVAMGAISQHESINIALGQAVLELKTAIDTELVSN